MCGCKFYEDEERQLVASDFRFMVEIVVSGSKLVSLAQPYILAKIYCFLNILTPYE